jgi:regulatory protein
MPQVTEIKPQLKNPNKVSIFIDDSYTFSLTISQLAEHPELKLKAELSPQQISNFKKLSNFTNQYLRLLNLIYTRPRSEKELKDKLRFKKVEPEEVEQLLAKLKSENYLNDAEFARWWINSRKNSKPISSLKLKAELTQKGIASTIISEALSQNFNSEDEFAALQNLISKKQAKYPDQAKLIAYLASKGFQYSQIKEALAKSG